jgi:nicotinate phosphoribosyltransferase
VFGTMAHSFIQAHDEESDAFLHFARSLPRQVILLIDTYDTEAGARKIVALAPRLRAEGIAIRGVRLDSGDLGEHAKKVRTILDDGGLDDVTIFASSSIDEDEIRRLLDGGAPIDGFGVGTRLDTSADAPYLDCAYKLQEYAGRPRRKRSEGKATWPGRKQVYRRFDESGRLMGDIVTVDGDIRDGMALIQPAMRAGRRLLPPTPLAVLRTHASSELRRLPDKWKLLEPAPRYDVEIAPALRDLAQRVDSEGEPIASYH